MYVRGKLQVVIFFGKGNSLCLLQFPIVLLHQERINADLSRCKCRSSDKFESRIANQFSSKPKEGLLKVVIGLGRDLEVLDALLPVEGHGGGLDLPLLDIDLVPAEHNRNIFTDAFKIAMPVGNVLIGDAGRDVKHYDATLALDVVAIAETTKLFLAGGIPDIEHDRAKVGGEGQRVNLNSERGDVFFLELSRQVTLDKCGFSCSSVANYASHTK